MDEQPMDETVDLDPDTFILLVYDRVWPKYVVSWSIRRRLGESDFPLASGAHESLPSRDGAAAATWERLREEALAEATTAAPRQSAPSEGKGLLARLFGRRA